MSAPTPEPASHFSAIQGHLETILENFSYTERALPEIGIGGELRNDLASFCDTLSSKTGGMRVSAALIQELLEYGNAGAREDALEMLEQLKAAIRGLMSELDEKVMAIRSISDDNPRDPALAGLSVLLHESGANILVASKAALDGLAAIEAQLKRGAD